MHVVLLKLLFAGGSMFFLTVFQGHERKAAVINGVALAQALALALALQSKMLNLHGQVTLKTGLYVSQAFGEFVILQEMWL